MTPPTRNAFAGHARRALVIALCLALVAGSAALAGCSSDSEPGKQTTPTKTSSAKDPQPAPPPAAPTLGPLALGKQTMCINNLKQIAVALGVWSAAHQGKIPEALQQLVDEEFITADMLKCPLASSDRACDYFFAPYSPGRAAPDRIVACDLDPHGGPGGKRAVLFVDGHVEVVSPEEFAKRLASKANQTVAPIFRATTKQD